MDSTFEQPISSRLDRNKSAQQLTTVASSNSLCSNEEKPTSSLRKVSSTLYNFAPSDNLQQQHPPQSHSTSVLSHWWNSHIGGGLTGYGSTHSIGKIPEEDQGLIMSVCSPSATAAATSSVLSAAKSAGILDSTSTSTTSQTTDNTTPDAAAANTHRRHPIADSMISLFGRGFLGKPVLSTEADNYRYIMALDR